MLRWIASLLTALILVVLPLGASAQMAVTNVTGSQRTDGSGRVDIRYNLSGASAPVSISVVVSPDDGATWTVIPREEYLSGDLGDGITNGSNRHIVWDVAADRPEIYWPNARVRVLASPGGGTPGEEITINLPGNVPLVMVRIPAGSFVMGSPASERGRHSWDDEGPQTNVTISRAFYMGKYPVTQAQWQAVRGSNPSHFSGRPNNPVDSVSWDDAQSFITNLNAHITSSGQGPATMRLPTEAEWEYAARAGTTTRFFFGDSLSVGDSCEDDGTRSQYMWYCGNSNSQTHPVGQKLPNAFGLYDMHGNVWEWCQDWFGSYPGGNLTDPTGPSGSLRVLRGGGWFDPAQYCRSAFRFGQSPSGWGDSVGFRLVLAVQ